MKSEIKKNKDYIHYMSKTVIRVVTKDENGEAVKYADYPLGEVRLAIYFKGEEEEEQDRYYLRSPCRVSVMKALGQDGYIQFLQLAQGEYPPREQEGCIIEEEDLKLEVLGIAIEKGLEVGEEQQMVLKKESEKDQLDLVGENGHCIGGIENPSKTVQITAVKQNGGALRHIQNPSEDVQLEAVRQNGAAIKFIKEPSEKIILAAIEQTAYAYKLIDKAVLEKLSEDTKHLIRLII